MPICLDDRIQSLIAEHLNVNKKYVTADVTFEDLGGDSLDAIELVMIMEEEFDITLDEDKLDACSTFGELANMVKEELGQ